MDEEKLINGTPMAKDKTHKYFIPWIENRVAPLDNHMISWNTLDSLAKYGGEHNRTLQLSQKPISRKSKTRPLSKEEIVGLASQETKFGVYPRVYIQDYNKVGKDFNFMRANKGIPGYALVNNYHWYNSTDKTQPPLLDAMRYYAQGDYNTKVKNKHIASVKNAGERLFKKDQMKTWWEMSGKYEYDAKEKPNFVKRLEEPIIRAIRSWEDENQIATHKLSYVENDDFDIVFPKIQEKPVKFLGLFDLGKTKLYDYSDPKNKEEGRNAYKNAKTTGNYLIVPKGMGEVITKTYKDIYPMRNVQVEDKNFISKIIDLLSFKQGGNINRTQQQIINQNKQLSSKNVKVYGTKESYILPKNITTDQAIGRTPVIVNNKGKYYLNGDGVLIKRK